MSPHSTELERRYCPPGASGSSSMEAIFVELVRGELVYHGTVVLEGTMGSTGGRTVKGRQQKAVMWSERFGD